MVHTPSAAKIRWAARRGMLELDLILERYLDATLAHMTPEELRRVEYLLLTPDPELYAYLMGVDSPKDEELANLVADIRAIDSPGTF